jgi:capsular polysaccharide biosynthesis protein
VELNDAARRILGQHWQLIGTLVLLGIIGAALMHLGDSKTYTASSRLVLGTEDPKTQAESASIADTAKAIATSPAVVRSALRRGAARNRDPVEFASQNVSVESVGASGVMQLRVTDRDAGLAAALTNALTREVIAARREVTEGELQRVLASVNPPIERLGRGIAALDALPMLSPDDEARRSALVQQRTALESERFSVLSSAAQQRKPAILSAATPPVRADSSGALPDLVLAALLGLILGVGVAAVIEALRPTLVGGEALARELNAPLLGGLTAGPHRNVRLGDQDAAVLGRLRLATKAAGVRDVSLLAAGAEDVDLPSLAHQFDARAWNGNGNGSTAHSADHDSSDADSKSACNVRPFDIRSDTLANGARTGLVVVSPNALKKAELDEVKNLLTMSPGPLLGVLTYTFPTSRRPYVGFDRRPAEQGASGA